LLLQKRPTSLFIGSAPRLAEDVVRPCRLPSRHARAKNALLAPNHAQRLGAFLLPAVYFRKPTLGLEPSGLTGTTRIRPPAGSSCHHVMTGPVSACFTLSREILS